MILDMKNNAPYEINETGVSPEGSSHRFDANRTSGLVLFLRCAFGRARNDPLGGDNGEGKTPVALAHQKALQRTMKRRLSASGAQHGGTERSPQSVSEFKRKKGAERRSQ